MSGCASLSPAPPATQSRDPKEEKSRSEAQAQRAQATLQVEEPIPKVQGNMDDTKPHTHRTRTFSEDVPLV